jgi:cell division topological specificity factor
MAFLDYFRKSSQRSAGVAKERLSIIVAREHRGAGGRLDYLPQLKQELLQVLAKYEKIDLEKVSVNLERNGDCEVLELNVVLAETEPPRAMPAIAASLSR